MTKLRLLVEEDGQKVWRTLEGKLLVGVADTKGEMFIGEIADNRMWFVAQAKNGKLVVYCGCGFGEPGTIRIFESFETMQAAIPEKIYQRAALEAGLVHPPQYPESPLDV